MSLHDLAQRVVTAAERCNISIVTAESCTAGRIAHLLAGAPGAGSCFHGGFVVYTKAMKTAVLDVPPDLLETKSAVCLEVAEAMARGALVHSPADVALAVTGVAGPDPDEDGNPVGLVFCAVAQRGGRSPRLAQIICPEREPDAILQTTISQALDLLKDVCLEPQHS